MVFLLLRLGLTLWMACCVTYGYVIYPGASRQAVIDAYGHPESQARTEGREILNYREGSVLLVEGRVVELRFYKAEPAPFRHSRVLEPSPVSNRTARGPTPTIAAPTSPQVMRTEKARINTPSAPERPPPLREPADRGTGFRIWILVLWALVAMVLIKVVWRWWFFPGNRFRTERLKGSDLPALLPPNAKRPPAYPLVAVDPTPTETRSEPEFAPTALTEELLARLEWRRFEILLQAYFSSQNWKAQRSRVGADGGIDIFLYRPGEGRPIACVQCKAWTTIPAGVKPVRELFGVMAAENIPEGYFICTYGYTAEARAFAEGKKLHLWSGADVLTKFQVLPESIRARILAEAFAGDFETPTCPSCDEKMILRQSEKPFWGCRRYPRCRRTFTNRREAATISSTSPH